MHSGIFKRLQNCITDAHIKTKYSHVDSCSWTHAHEQLKDAKTIHLTCNFAMYE